MPRPVFRSLTCRYIASAPPQEITAISFYLLLRFEYDVNGTFNAHARSALFDPPACEGGLYI